MRLPTWPPVVAMLLIGLLAGCASAPVDEAKPLAPPLLPALPEVWRLFDADVWAASHQGRLEAERYAKAALGEWMDRVRQRTEEAYIPWYTSFGTQQWLSLKVGWYGLTAAEGERTAAERLAEYLQGQYYKRVLEPVSGIIDPQTIRERATARFAQSLADDVRGLANRYRLPPDVLRERLDRIPAILIYGDPPLRASLDEILSAQDPARIPAYSALLRQIHPDDEGLATGMSRNRVDSAARSSADKLADQLALRGGATAAGLAMGGIGGILISVAISGWQAMEHEKDKAALEADLRSNLDSALERTRRYLTEDPYGGITAPVSHMSTQIENGLLSAELLAEQQGSPLLDIRSPPPPEQGGGEGRFPRW